MPRVGERILPALTDDDASAHQARISAALYQTFASQLHMLIDRLDNLWYTNCPCALRGPMLKEIGEEAGEKAAFRIEGAYRWQA